MKQLIVVGHPASNYRSIERLLYKSGMNFPIAVENSNLTPIDINQKICMDYGIRALPGGGNEATGWIPVDAIWHAGACELMHSNRRQPIWGWADPMAIYLLDYWKKVFADTYFVLVFHHPESGILSLGTATHVSNTIDPLLESVIDTWQSYNRALIEFFKNNTNHCILVHGHQVLLQPEALIRYINHLTGVAVDSSDTEDRLSFNSALRQSVPPMLIRKIEEPLTRYLTTAILHQFPDAMSLYDELQYHATLPMEQQLLSEYGVDDAWHSLRKILSQNAQLIEQVCTTHSSYPSEEQAQASIASKAVATAAGASESTVASKSPLPPFQGGDNAEIPLEKEVSGISTRSSNNTDSPDATPEVLTGAAKRFKNDLEYQLGARILKLTKFVFTLPFLPWFVRRFIAQHRQAARHRTHSLPPLNQYKDYAEVALLKQHLTYKLGVSGLRSIARPASMLVMPIALLGTWARFRKAKRRRATLSHAGDSK